MLLNNIELSLGISPVVTGQHTAFKGSTLILSSKDVIATQMGQIDKVSYIVHHELYHKRSWDLLLVDMVKNTTKFNCFMLAFFYAYVTLATIFTFIDYTDNQQLWLNIILMYLIGYGWYRLFFKAFDYFSMFKEHLADEYALLKTHSLAVAKSVLGALTDGKNKLHPPPQARIDYLQHRQSALPLKLFLILNFIWMMVYIIPARISMSFFVEPPWADAIFMALNLPLIVLIGYTRQPKSTRWLSYLTGALMLTYLLIQASIWHYLTVNYNPMKVKSYFSHIGENLSLYYCWFILVLMLSQWPRKSTK